MMDERLGGNLPPRLGRWLAGRWPARLAVLLAFVVVVLAAALWYPPLWQAGYMPAAHGAAFIQADGLLDINTAGVAQLTALPGIGEKRAEAIIEYRTAHGAFTDVDQLLEVPGIGPKILEGIREHITC